MNKSLLLALTAILILVSSMVAVAEVYRWVDENGKVHFSDDPSVAQKSQRIEVNVNAVKTHAYANSDQEADKKVIMYSASWCGVCKKARRYFIQEGINFKEYDIETSAFGKAAYRKLKARSVPIILVGNQRMDGFSVSGFERLYQ